MDTLKPISVTVFDCYFEYEPFYIGYGQRYRDTEHIRIAKRELDEHSHKLHKIRKLLDEDRLKVVRLKSDLSIECALTLEKHLIDYFGRICLGTGCLTNIIDGGLMNPVLHGCNNGFYGKKHTKETLTKIKEKNKLYFDNLSDEEKEEINRKRSMTLKATLSTKPREFWEEAARKRNITNNHNTDESKYIKKINKLNVIIRKAHANKAKKIKESRKFKNMTDEQRREWNFNNRVGENNPNYGNGDKISGSKNGRAKFIEISFSNGEKYITNGNFKKFVSDFRKHFNCVNVFRESYNKEKEGIFIKEVDNIYDNSILYDGNFDRISDLKFKKARNKRR
jgi:hypothetical protein